MRPTPSAVATSAALAALVAFTAASFARSGTKSTYVDTMPEGYRDWKLVSVAHEAGELNDIRAILGNDKAIDSYRRGVPFPDGAIIARVAWDYVSSEENNQSFGRAQSFVAGAAKNGVQFMMKDSRKYAATGGWGYGQFDSGRAAGDTALKTCFPCHQRVSARDFVFTRYSP
jgi:hypothetical protein